MPYYSRRHRRRYRKRYPRSGRGNVDWYKMAKTAFTGVKYLKSIVNVEKHPLVTTGSDSPGNTTLSLRCLNLTAQGDDDFSRDGNRILLKSININSHFQQSGLATSTVVRLLLFIDTQSNGTTPVTSDILQSSSIQSNYNHDNVGFRYKILADKTINLSSGTAVQKMIQTYRKLNFHTQYDGTTAVIGNIVDNALWLGYISDQPVNVPGILTDAQMLFIDN